MHKKLLITVVLLIAVLLVTVSGLALAAGDHEYVGVKKCAMCHRSESKGNQHGQWLSTKHSKAYETLASPSAYETASQAGISGDPQQAPECLKCHVTGFGEDSSLFGSGFAIKDGVQCEACHGAGKDYKAMSVMKNREKSIAAGLIIPTEEVCLKCHNEESPNFTGFDFDEYYEKVNHPKP